MLNLIERFFRSDRSHKAIIRQNFTQYFFSLPEHHWITGQVRIHFETFLAKLPSGVLEALMTKYPIVFVRNQDWKMRPGTVHSNSIVVFPEFQRLVESDKKSAVAYLAHELAFVLYELEEQNLDPMMAEVEADKFVCDLGLIYELEELLLMLDETIEKRLRLTYLTIHSFKDC